MARLGLCLFGAILAFFTFFPSLLQAQFVILSEPDDVVHVHAGHDLRLDVRFSNTGSFGASVTWNFNGSTLLFKDYGTNAQGQISLTINNTSLRHHGTYHLVWTASSSGRRSYVVIIKDKPTTVSFTSNTTSNIATVGDNVKLTCVADGIPSPSYTITFDETEVEDASGILIIKNASDDCVGTYRCDAKNSLGNLSKQLFLNVKKAAVTTTMPSTSVNTANTISSSSGTKARSGGGDSVRIIVGCVVAVLVAHLIDGSDDLVLLQRFRVHIL